jgi:hypothetical protein
MIVVLLDGLVAALLAVSFVVTHAAADDDLG